MWEIAENRAGSTGRSGTEKLLGRGTMSVMEIGREVNIRSASHMDTVGLIENLKNVILSIKSHTFATSD